MNFFDKIGEKATEVYNTTAEKTNKITQEVKLKSSANEFKSKITKIYQQIGEEIYNSYKSGKTIKDEKEYNEQLFQIDEYQKELDKINQELRTLKDIKLCLNCSKEIKVEAKFCPYCGKKQEDLNKQEKSENTNSLNIIEKMEEPEVIVEQVGNDSNKE